MTALQRRVDVAYRALRADILTGRRQPDTTLSTYRLAEELGMSRTPIIGALKRLEADALIEIIPQVGCRVLPRVSEEIAETFMIRAALESLAAELAATRVSDDELATLDEILGRAEAACTDADAYRDADREFHTAILAASRLPQLRRMVGMLWTLNRYQLAASQFLATRIAVSCAEHREILEALRAHDRLAARAAVDRHLRQCSRDYLRFVESSADL